MTPTLSELQEEVTARVTGSLCSGCPRARKTIDLWCWACLMRAIRNLGTRDAVAEG